MPGLKLGGVADGVVHATSGLSAGTWNRSRGFEAIGSVPGSDLLARLFNRPVIGGLLGRLTGSVTTTNLWPIGGDRLLATVGTEVFFSTNGGHSWRLVHHLPHSSGPMGVLPSSLCRHEGRLYLAEYPLDEETANVLVSDDGLQWEPYVRRSDVRHFHGLFHDPYTGSLWGTTGDTDEESAIGRFINGEFYPVGRGSQTWRAVDLAFTPDSVLWGMDCSYAPQIKILRLPRADIPPASAEPSAEQPEPKPLVTVDGPVFYAETLESDDTTWVVFSTAATGTDSTGPGTDRSESQPVSVVAASQRSGYEQWHQLISLNRSTTLGRVLPAIPTANAYAFLASTADGELLINPYNTGRAHGDILVRQASSFSEAPQLSTETIR